MSNKRPLSFCVVVESHLSAEDTQKILRTILDVGLADAADTLESDVDDEARQTAQDAVDIDVHAPTLLELPPLSTFPPHVPAVEAALSEQCASLSPGERVDHVVAAVLCDGTLSLHRALRIAFPEAGDATPPTMDISNAPLVEQLQAWVSRHVHDEAAPAAPQP